MPPRHVRFVHGKLATPFISQLPARAAYCLINLGVETIEQARQMTDAQLLRQSNLGKKSLREIRALAPYCGPRPSLEVEIKRIQAKVKTIEGMLRGLKTDLDTLAERFVTGEDAPHLDGESDP